MLVIFRNIFTPHARIFRKFIINVPHVHNIASQTMGKIYFETFQSLWLMKIVMKLCTLPPRNIFFQKKRPPTDHCAKSIILPSNPGPHCGLMGHEGFIRQTQTLIASRRLKLGQGWRLIKVAAVTRWLLYLIIRPLWLQFENVGLNSSVLIKLYMAWDY